MAIIAGLMTAFLELPVFSILKSKLKGKNEMALVRLVVGISCCQGFSYSDIAGTSDTIHVPYLSGVSCHLFALR